VKKASVQRAEEWLYSNCAEIRPPDTPKCPRCGKESYYRVRADPSWSELSLLGRLRRLCGWVLAAAVAVVALLTLGGIIIGVVNWGLGQWLR